MTPTTSARRWNRLTRTFVFGVWGFLLPWSAWATVAPGEGGYVSDVNGAASFRIPIAVPPGAGGFAPNLALSYSSRGGGGDGPFGVGWTLGLPEIRCSARFGVPDFASCTQYELGDTLLVQASAGRYHTIVESFQRILFLANGSWTVEQPNGTKLFFGESASHRVVQGGSTARWLLERMENPFDVEIFFTYDTTTDTGEAYPSKITYGAGASPSLGPREIRFTYEDRLDPRLLFTGGVKRRLTKRLREIQVVSGGGYFRRYAFGYDDVPGYATNRSRLTWVQEFGKDCTDDTTVVSCTTSLPRRRFRYHDASDVGSARYSQSANDPDYRVPFGDYTSSGVPLWRNNFPVLIGDLNGDGLPDRIEILTRSSLALSHDTRVLINTGDPSTGFESGSALAQQYRTSFRNLTYTKPYWEFQQIPVPAPNLNPNWANWGWSQSMYAMCSVTPRTRTGVKLAEELLSRGASARTSTLSQQQANGGAGSFEPFPSVKMADLDADGYADLVVSVRLGGVSSHFNCSGQPLTTSYAAQTKTVVFRNTGSGGWLSSENDAAAQELAEGLPPFEEILVKSTYQTEIDEPSQYELVVTWSADSPCANRSIWGFEQTDNYHVTPSSTAVCHSMIDLAPQFVDFNGDGYLDLAVLVRDDPNSFWTGGDSLSGQPNPAKTPRTLVWIQKPEASGSEYRWQRAHQYDLPAEAWPATWDIPGLAHAGLQHDVEGASVDPTCYSWEGHFQSCSPNTYRFDNGVRLVDLNRDGLVDVVWSGMGQRGAFLNTGRGTPGASPARYSAWCASNADDVGEDLLDQSCPEAAVYQLPDDLVYYPYRSKYPVSTGLLADLNGDGFPDYVLLDPVVVPTRSFLSWIHDPGASGSALWKPDQRFDFYVVCQNCQVPHPVTGSPMYATDFSPRFEAFDIDGDGADDVVGDTDAFFPARATAI